MAGGFSISGGDEKTLIGVDLPAPLWPTSAITSPG
jgi:hypothetical protein